jgi:peptidylprolyl isomerase
MALAQSFSKRQQMRAGAQKPFSGSRPRAVSVTCKASSSSQHSIMQKAAAMAAAGVIAFSGAAFADDDGKMLCDASCVSALESKEMVTTPSGLQYKEIVPGTGPQPITGYQVVVNYVAMTPAGRVFENSLEKQPFDIRVGAGQVLPGLDEGLLSMKVGGVRRLYIPGELAFPKPLRAAAGRPSVPANSPMIFDVQLLYIPGLDMEE